MSDQRSSVLDAVVFNESYRIFFLLCSGYAIVGVAAWLLVLNGISWPGAPVNPVLWHIHELSVGFLGAAAAGFLLTAAPVWTGQPAPRGGPLVLLATAWLLGRAAAAFGTEWPSFVVAALALWFPVQLAAMLARLLIVAGNRRNYLLGVIVALLPLAEVAYQLGRTKILPGSEYAVYLLPHFGALLIVIIGGRIIPAFTGNWLRMQGRDMPLPLRRSWIEYLALASTVAVALGTVFAATHPLSGALAFMAALIHGIRLSGWCGMRTLSNPLLAVLHLGYLWLPVSYALLAFYVLGWVPHSAALHALTVGAIGTVILAVMSRVALGHSGRALRASKLTVLAYGLMTLAALVRVLAPLIGAVYVPLLDTAALAWCLAWVLFLWVYWPILTGPRVNSS